MQPVPANQLFAWTIQGSITVAAQTFSQNFKTMGFPLNVAFVTGSLYDATGAIVEGESLRDKIRVNIQWEDTQSVFTNTPMDFFNFISIWNQYASQEPIVLRPNTDVTFSFNIDTTTAINTVPVRCELNFVGLKGKLNQ